MAIFLNISRTLAWRSGKYLNGVGFGFPTQNIIALRLTLILPKLLITKLKLSTLHSNARSTCRQMVTPIVHILIQITLCQFNIIN